MEIKINKEKSTPLYYQLKEQIKAEIINKNFTTGVKIPAEREIMKTFNLSYQTVTRAFRELVYEGFIERIPGKGTFVTDREKDLLTIGLVIPHLYLDKSGDVKYFGTIVNSIEDEANKNRANILICFDNDNVEKESENLKNLLERKVDGIILYYIGEEKNIKLLKEIQNAGIPFVLIDRYIEGIKTDYVTVDNFKGAYQATKFLLEKGFTQIFHITNPEKCNTTKDRIEGFKKAIAEYNVIFDDSMIKKTNSPFTAKEDTYNLTKGILEETSSSFGIFATNFSILLGVIRAIEEKRIRYSEFGLACFDEPPIDIPEEVPFVEVIQPLEQIGRKSVQIIFDKLRGKKEIQQIVLEPTIKIVNKRKHEENGY